MIALLALLLALVNSPVNSVPYACDGSTAVYAITFPYLDYTDLKVTTTASDGTVTALVYTTDFTVNLASTSSTATLTLNSPASKCPVGNTLKITRSLALTQPASFRSQTSFDQSLHERAYDRLEMQIQQMGGGLEAAGLTGASAGTITGFLSPSRGGMGNAAPNCLAGGQALTTNGLVQSCITMPAVAASSHAYYTTASGLTGTHGSVTTTFATLVVPNGIYTVTALANVEVVGRSGLIGLNQCKIVSSGLSTLFSQEYAIQDFGKIVYAAVTYTNTLGPDTLTFTCRNTAAVLDLNVVNVIFTATTVGALN